MTKIKRKSRHKKNKGRQENLKNKKNNGITLIALVITIIVLLVLAGVTIATLTGENGILTRASQASEKTKQASAEEQVQLAVVGSIGKDGNINIDSLNDELAKVERLEYNGNPISNANRVEKLPIAVAVDEYEMGILGNGEIVTIASIEDIQNTIYVPEKTFVQVVNNNYIVLPKDFMIRVDDSTNNADSIDEGIVIEDQKGNQYVWIPVDGILGENGKTVQSAKDGEIILGRYVFDSNGNIDTENAIIPETLGGELSPTTSTSYTETSIGNGNAVSKDINGFIDSVRNNGGYYFARYEAGDENTTIDRTDTSSDDNPIVVKSEKYVYNYVTQLQASNLCQNLYSGVSSDLMNSYAWDTAILFIQRYEQNNYSRQDGNSINSSPQMTGLSGDVQLNIYDMAGNLREWTTETNKSSDRVPCTYRGGIYSNSTHYTSYRLYYGTNTSNSNCTFRPVLYL